MEKSRATCPNCRTLKLNIYYDDGDVTPLAAMCDNCAFKGYYVDQELIPLPPV